ncbi:MULTISPECIES: SAM-dependent methyltransferase [Thermomonosporaceae]|uniref:SAM-dependent methyltransferase n=1 Tax=Thermomonosporaceae TaxID=2012 RepID=UPI00255A8A6A|nr:MULTISPECIES: SAM-dependent methyltransferase [Thermomonosporaceae]MDL4773065.1 SAM-dependent methyltransferase [Actinomadura xylanilytica]
MQDLRSTPSPGIDPTTASVARMYDYYLHGKDNFQIDRDAADRVAQAMPEIGLLALENRAFLRRSVRYMARQGIRQFLDIGSGLPTAGNTHEIAREITPDARVVYVDSDPVVRAHGSALLAADDRTTVALADMHRPREVLDHPETTRLIDFDEPVGVLMIAMIHFLTLEERGSVLGTLRDALAPGSYLSSTHVTTEGHAPEAVDQIEGVYATTPTPIYFRSKAEIAPFFEGFTPVDPGLVTIDQWNPESDEGDAPAEKIGTWLYGAVGHKA